MNTAEQNLELGKLYCDRGDFLKGEEAMSLAASAFYAAQDFANYLKVTNYLLRIYAETDRFGEVNATKDKIQDLVLREGFELTSKTYHTLATCAFYKGQIDTALEYWQKALALGLSADNKEDICFAIFGIALVYSRPQVGKYAEALKEIYNLQVFFQVFDLPELRFSTQILNASILATLKKYDEAIDILWRSYEDLKACKSVYLGINLLANLGATYGEAGDKDMAKMYLHLAMRSVDKKNHVRLAQQIQLELEKLGGGVHQNFDLIFDEENHSVVEKKLGRIEFKNQFILLDLLRLFVQNQGTVYSKEFLVEHVWKQPYDPVVHDNKIYVTIKRLRKLIEPDFDKPKYIFRAKNGYYMNKSARVLLEM